MFNLEKFERETIYWFITLVAVGALAGTLLGTYVL